MPVLAVMDECGSHLELRAAQSAPVFVRVVILVSANKGGGMGEYTVLILFSCNWITAYYHSTV